MGLSAGRFATGPRRLLGCLALILAGSVPARALPQWVQLGPPTAGRDGSVVIYDTQRNRTLALMPPLRDPTLTYEASEDLWATTGDEPVRWTRIAPGPPLHDTGGLIGIVYDPNRDRLWAMTKSILYTERFDPARLWTLDFGTLPLQWVERPAIGSGGSDSFVTGYPQVTAWFDTPRDRILALGESGGVAVLSLTGTPTWTPLNARVTGGRFHGSRDCSVVYDPWRDRLLVYGGFIYNPDTRTTTIFDETWALSFSDTTWTFLAPRRFVPPARSLAVSALDRVGRRWLVMGGTPASDGWALDLSPSAPADSATWTPFAPEGPRPPDRFAPMEWTDPVRNHLVAYGGESGGTLERPGRRCVDSWSLDLGADSPRWRRLTLDAFPVSGGPTIFVNPAPGHLVSVFGGVAWEGTIDLGGTADPAVAGPILGPSPLLYGAAMAIDEVGSRIFVFGGSTDPAGAASTGGLFAIPFRSPLEGSVLASGPPARSEAAAMFDPGRGRLVIHGGRMKNSRGFTVPFADTWAWDAAANRWGTLPAGGFGARWGEKGVYDPIGDRFLVLGGEDSAQSHVDVHALAFSPGATWQELPTVGAGPAFLLEQDRNVVFDRVGNRLLVVGSDFNTNHFTVWQLSLGDVPTWSQVPTGPTEPPLREGIGLALDPRTGNLFMVDGGADSWALLGALPPQPRPPVPVSVSTVDSTLGRVRIVWQAGDATRATAWRQVSADPWVLLDTLQVADGIFTLEDHDVQPARAYHYRLGIQVDTSSVFVGEVDLTTPATPIVPSLALAGPTTQPVTGALDVSFTLASGSTASLDLLDITGRRVLTRAVGQMGSGVHVLRLEPRPAPGLYFLRLRQGDQTRTARAILIR